MGRKRNGLRAAGVAVLVAGVMVHAASAQPAAAPAAAEDAAAFVRVSPRDVRYFELSDGKPYIPIGLNMAGPPGDGLEGMERWFSKLAKYGGNFVRVWLSNPYFDVEPTRSGQYDEKQAERIDRLIALGRKYGIRLKLCTEHFRHLGEGKQKWAAKPLHLIANGGPARDTADFFNGQAGREQYRRKLAWLAARYGNEPTVFAWELWNEMDAVAVDVWRPWTQIMLPELHRQFPKNLCVQSLGSFDNESKRARYRALCEMPGNDVLQVHRYLDQGAKWSICHGPVDRLAAEAVRELQSYGVRKPILLAESGAVEPNHSGPSKLYAQDKAGIILHDVLFAAFFAGAAGPGHIWHWDAYVDRNDLWWHFGRFAAVVRDLDPPAEGFAPFQQPHERLRVLGLKGTRTTLAWCRDKQDDWQHELEQGQPPETLRGLAVPLAAAGVPGATVEVYDPWHDRWSTATVIGREVRLPEFSRSVVIRVRSPRN